ncbi:hypothetical protein D3C80_1612730 [compost metagenome]
MHEHFTRGLMPGVLILQGTEQAVQVIGFGAGRVAGGLRQCIHRVAELRLKVSHQRCRQCHHETFNVFMEAKTMHGQWRQDLDRGLVEQGALAFDLQLRLAFEYKQ